MSIFVKATMAKKPRTRESQIVAYSYAFMLVIIVLCQLFTFDKFLALIGDFGLPGGLQFAYFLGSFIVISEVFALPFLLGMQISPLMRVFSMSLSLVVPINWLKLSLWLNLTDNNIINVGFLGDVVNLIPGWWAVFISLSLGLMALWSSWGLWPGKRK